MAVAVAQAASHVLSLPIALGGEAETADNLGLGILSIISIAVGYVGLFALWFFVFRDKSRSKRKKDSSSD